MRNKLFETALDSVSPKTKEKIRNYTDMVDIIEEAYRLYMPQVKSEITKLAEFIQKDIFDKRENDPFYQYNILEIGTKFGGTFYIWNKLNELTNGKNISIDMSDGGLHGGISEEEMDKRDLWFHERFDNCHFIRGDSHLYETANKAFSVVEPDNKISVWFDFLFIDGDHTYEGVKKDFFMYEPFVKKNSKIVFHDIIDTERHRNRNVFVSKLWQEITELKLPKNQNCCVYGGQVYEFKEFIDGNEDFGGIGILIKI